MKKNPTLTDFFLIGLNLWLCASFEMSTAAWAKDDKTLLMEKWQLPLPETLRSKVIPDSI